MRFWICVLLLSASSLASPAERAVAIPAQFLGEWNAKLSDCGTGENDSRLRVAPRSLSYYESSGPIRAAVSRGRYEIALIVELSGEGETWLATEHFKLSPDENRLESIAQAGAPFVRYRCQKQRK